MRSFNALFALTILLPQISFADIHNIDGYVGSIRYHEANNTVWASWSKKLWFKLENPSKEVEKCLYDSSDDSQDGYYIAVPEDNETAIAMILSAKMMYSKIQVRINDDQKIHDHCKLQYITIL